ncbi:MULTISPECIES: CoA-binding protein [Streptomyces]|uniref:CoA-binding protein n=1 Tax=Streptomyces TaxID=1883 RepID=UPI0014895A1C|nr:MULTISPECIES: CoA-binding protein [Streptomyces]
MRPLLRNIRRAGFASPVYAVNPHAHAIEDTPCFPTVTALPRTPELAVLAVPARAVPDVAEECGKAGAWSRT